MERWRLRDREIVVEVEEEETIRIGFWPDLSAHVSDEFDDGAWHPLCPELRVVYPMPSPPRQRGVQLEFPFEDERRPTEDDYWREAVDAFRTSLPDAVARVVEPFHWGQWHLLKACRTAPRFAELIRSNPILAMLWVLNEPEEFQTERELHEVSGTSQRLLLEDLGADGRRSTLKMLRRVVVASFDRYMGRALGFILTDAHALERLRHLPRIGRGVVALVEEPELLELCSPSLLHQVAIAKDEVMAAHTATKLIDYIADCERLGVPPRRFKHRYEVDRDSARAAWEVWERKRRGEPLGERAPPLDDWVYPPPPILGTKTIEPITTHTELCLEGSKQRNCLLGPNSSDEYERKIATRRFYLYRVTWPERCTLTIVRTRQGRWQRLELRAMRNAKPKKKTKKHVDQWLEGAARA